jgi:hypothetical protein
VSAQDGAGGEGPGMGAGTCWLAAGVVLLVVMGFVPLVCIRCSIGVGERASCWQASVVHKTYWQPVSVAA